MKKQCFYFLTAGLLLSVTTFAQTKINVSDYLNVAGPIIFQKKAFNLAWSSHPNEAYYKQEYVATGETVEKFRIMILLEALTGPTALKDIVAAKIEELRKTKTSNPLIQYEMFQKDGNYIIDFLLSANGRDGKSIEVIERNVYRYTSLASQPGVVLFAVSTRAYGKDVTRFLADLKTTKPVLLNAVAAFNIPVVKLKK